LVVDKRMDIVADNPATVDPVVYQILSHSLYPILSRSLCRIQVRDS
jgi:hypothetical protein